MFAIGSYVGARTKTINSVGIVVGTKEGSCQVLFHDQKKYWIKESNLVDVGRPKADQVGYKGSLYLVTHKNTIISMKTKKIMQWAEGNGDRQAILDLAIDALIPF